MNSLLPLKLHFYPETQPFTPKTKHFIPKTEYFTTKTGILYFYLISQNKHEKGTIQTYKNNMQLEERHMHVRRPKNKGTLVFHGVKVNIGCDLHMQKHQGSYRQDCVKFKDFSRTSKRLSYCLQGLKT